MTAARLAGQRLVATETVVLALATVVGARFLARLVITAGRHRLPGPLVRMVMAPAATMAGALKCTDTLTMAQTESWPATRRDDPLAPDAGKHIPVRRAATEQEARQACDVTAGRIGDGRRGRPAGGRRAADRPLRRQPTATATMVTTP